eukprot:gene23507-6316_t
MLWGSFLRNRRPLPAAAATRRVRQLLQRCALRVARRPPPVRAPVSQRMRCWSRRVGAKGRLVSASMLDGAPHLPEGFLRQCWGFRLPGHEYTPNAPAALHRWVARVLCCPALIDRARAVPGRCPHDLAWGVAVYARFQQ